MNNTYMKIRNKERQMRPICCRSGVTDRLRSYEGKEDVKKGWIQGWGASHYPSAPTRPINK